MNNPFETIDARLTNIECLLLDLKHTQTPLQDLVVGDQLLTIKQAAALINLIVQVTINFFSKRTEAKGLAKRNRLNKPGNRPDLIINPILILYLIYEMLKHLIK